MKEPLKGPTFLGGMLDIVMNPVNNGFFFSSSIGGLDTGYGLTISFPIRLSRTWFSSSVVHRITEGSSIIFPLGLFLFSPIEAVMA